MMVDLNRMELKIIEEALFEYHYQEEEELTFLSALNKVQLLML